jgi:hypothetical protein
MAAVLRDERTDRRRSGADFDPATVPMIGGYRDKRLRRGASAGFAWPADLANSRSTSPIERYHLTGRCRVPPFALSTATIGISEEPPRRTVQDFAGRIVGPHRGPACRPYG